MEIPLGEVTLSQLDPAKRLAKANASTCRKHSGLGRWTRIAAEKDQWREKISLPGK